MELNLTWKVYQNEIDSLEKYCHNCGSKVIFTDSLKRRHNANGKNIYYFAIYKCLNGHTYNKPLKLMKAKPSLDCSDANYIHLENKTDDIWVESLKIEGITDVSILLETCEIKERLDKFLSSKIKDISRSKISEMIQAGMVIINGKKVKPKVKIKEKDCIKIKL